MLALRVYAYQAAKGWRGVSVQAFKRCVRTPAAYSAALAKVATFVRLRYVFIKFGIDILAH
jgi:hypothetical protein